MPQNYDSPLTSTGTQAQLRQALGYVPRRMPTAAPGSGVTVDEASGEIGVTAGFGAAYMPLTLGDEPPTLVTDGAGRLIMVAFAP